MLTNVQFVYSSTSEVEKSFVGMINDLAGIWYCDGINFVNVADLISIVIE